MIVIMYLDLLNSMYLYTHTKRKKKKKKTKTLKKKNSEPFFLYPFAISLECSVAFLLGQDRNDLNRHVSI